jgi:hypothetical protein
MASPQKAADGLAGKGSDGEMPVLGCYGKTVRIIAGSILGGTSPVRTSS